MMINIFDELSKETLQLTVFELLTCADEVKNLPYREAREIVRAKAVNLNISAEIYEDLIMGILFQRNFFDATRGDSNG
jgi:hypothetical protein